MSANSPHAGAPPIPEQRSLGEKQNEQLPEPSPAREDAAFCSLVGLISIAFDDFSVEAAHRGVLLSWAVDPLAPPYIAVGRADLMIVMGALIRLALANLSQAALNLSILGSHAKNTLEIVLETDSEGLQQVPSSQWQHLKAWLEPMECELSAAEGLWRCIVPIQTVRLSQVDLGEGPKVLVLSSDTDTRYQTKQAVQDFGHTVIEANDPDEAVALCKLHDFALVLIDADLRGSLGLQFARNLRVAAPSQPLLALLSSSLPDSSEDFDWIKLWMHKPPRKSELALGFAAASARVKKRQHKIPFR